MHKTFLTSLATGLMRGCKEKVKPPRILAVIAVALCSYSANAEPILVFQQDISGGSITHTAGGEISGIDVSLSSLVVTGTAFDGVYALNNTVLNFTSGVLSNEGDISPVNDWSWSAGGSFSITGTVFGLLGATGILASGSFDDGIVASNFSNFMQILGFGFDDKNSDLLTSLGIPLATDWSFGMALVSSEASILNDGSFGGFVDGGDFTNTGTASVAVPEPGTLALICIGLFGMGLTRRSRTA